MAKTESTAVNALIGMVQNESKPLVVDPGADLFGGAAAKRAGSPDMFGGEAPKRASSPRPQSMTMRASSPIVPRPPSQSASSIGITLPTPQKRPSLPPPTRSTSSAGLTVPSTFSASSAGLTVPSTTARMTPPPAPAPRGSNMPLDEISEFAPLPRSRAPQSTAEQSIPMLPVTEARVRFGTAQIARGTTIPPLSRTPAGTLPPPNTPVAAPFEPKKQELLFDVASAPDAGETFLVDPSTEKRTRAENIALAKMLIIPGIAVIAAGIGLGFYVSGNKSKSSSTTASTSAPAPTLTKAPTPSAPPTETVLHPTPRSLESANAATASAGGEQPQPPTKEEDAARMAAAAAESGSLTSDAPAEAVAKVGANKGVPTFADVRIDTDPQGAAITLLDGGKRFPLGSTPLSTALDPTRQYEILIELEGRPSQTIHLDPATTTRVDIPLGKKQRTAAAPAAPGTVAPVAAPKAKTEAKAEDKGALSSAIDDAADKPEATPKAKTEKTEPKAEAAKAEKDAPATAGGNGTLMVSSKPPCEILIDGAPTGLTTPQRAIDLPVGKHKITFVNTEAGINKTVSVTIKADQPTKLIEDLMAK